MSLPVIIASIVCMIPLGLAYVMSGKEGAIIFLCVVACFVGIALLWILAHWAIQTVLVALGCDKDEINKERGNSSWWLLFLFWK